VQVVGALLRRDCCGVAEGVLGRQDHVGARSSSAWPKSRSERPSP
jgi:hypothetical protein